MSRLKPTQTLQGLPLPPLEVWAACPACLAWLGRAEVGVQAVRFIRCTCLTRCCMGMHLHQAGWLRSSPQTAAACGGSSARWEWTSLTHAAPWLMR